MTKKEAQNLVYSNVEKWLIEYGYKFNKSREIFELKKGDFIYYINVNIIDRYPQFHISFFLSIRNNKIENIANEFSRANPNNFKFTTTIIILFSYFTEGIRNEFILMNEGDISSVEEYFVHLYSEKINPLIEDINSIDKLSLFVDNCISEKNESIFIDSKLYYRCLILLRLTNNDSFENRASSFRSIFNNYSDNDKEDFERIYHYLKSM